MDRNKLLAIGIAALAATGVIVYGLGTAQAATWHDYKGDIFAGHAYGLMVPADAKAYEIVLSGDNASAQIAVFNPDNEKIGYYALSGDLTTASVASPSQGRHVIYVYDLADGALSLRVDAEQEPALDLQQIPLAREDVTVGSQDSPGKLDKVFTTTLKATPVFATLLYEGSAQKLDATVASAKGDVVTIAGESGTAFSPGVWTSLTGSRVSNPANLDGLAYTVTAHAAKFEGRLVLTTLALDMKNAPAPAVPGVVPMPPQHKMQHKMNSQVAMTDTFAFPAGKAIAFDAIAGSLYLEPANAVQTNDDDEGHQHVDDVISIYAPDDTLLAFIELTDDKPNATVELPVDGEYVAYAHSATNKAVLAHLMGSSMPVSLRPLAVANESFEFEGNALLFSMNEGQPIEITHVPVAMKITIAEGATSVFGGIYVTNDNGVVASSNSALMGTDAFFGSYTWQSPENFAAGTHQIAAQGIFEGKATLESVYYLRHQIEEEPAEPVAPEAAEEPEIALLGLLN